MARKSGFDGRRLAAFGTLAAAPAGALQSLKSLRAQEAEERALAAEVGYTNSVCGASIEAVIDWRSADGWPEDESLADACDGALGALEAVCRAGGDRARSISTFVCAGDGAGPSLRGSVLRYGATPGGDGFGETRRFLESIW
ncbi:hypothetical protein [Amphiplicatus metriothermophilus]|nr:hypothetical protein [Amphiplicatus metriothermophilus]MBB5517930.1 hypothetical protein [Amphiplicatus metriothermophilus]